MCQRGDDGVCVAGAVYKNNEIVFRVCFALCVCVCRRRYGRGIDGVLAGTPTAFPLFFCSSLFCVRFLCFFVPLFFVFVSSHEGAGERLAGVTII